LSRWETRVRYFPSAAGEMLCSWGYVYRVIKSCPDVMVLNEHESKDLVGVDKDSISGNYNSKAEFVVTCLPLPKIRGS
jgi:hypothetical protein